MLHEFPLVLKKIILAAFVNVVCGSHQAFDGWSDFCSEISPRISICHALFELFL
jgi:hypothetical protein